MSSVSTTRPIIIGNWKMNGLSTQLAEVRLLAAMLEGVELRCDVVVCPPATLIRPVFQALEGTAISVGGQDCHSTQYGAFTGDISAEMLRDAGAKFVIVGHSERRLCHDETNRLVRQKVAAAHDAGLCAVLCVGESEEEKARGLTIEVVMRQLAESMPDRSSPAQTIIAYEPVWAIGSGRIPSGSEIEDVHGAIRAALAGRMGGDAARAMRILYGGSMKPANAGDILSLSNVDGGLIGQASLKAKDFLGIIARFAPA